MSQRDDATAACRLVQMNEIAQRFARLALRRTVDFEVRAGRVHVLAVENGAGKSTRIKILAWVNADHEGTVQISGQPVRSGNQRQTALAGAIPAADRPQYIPAEK